MRGEVGRRGEGGSRREVGRREKLWSRKEDGKTKNFRLGRICF